MLSQIELPYPVFVGENALAQFSNWLGQQTKFSQIVLLVDEQTLRHCVPDLITEVSELEGVEFIEIEQGEEQKNIEVASQLWLTLSDLKLDRNALLINVGGGVIGDLGGFVAAAYKRGIQFIQIPTTLLAMVDASVGGKVGIDLGGLKNQIGFFAMPAAVVVYTPFLDTLDVQQIKSGYAEMIKHGLIVDAAYYQQLTAFDLQVDEKIINTSIAIKAAIVKEDFEEEGKRKLLNFGHTFGHAFESFFLDTPTPILHGMAVAAGMICEILASKMLLELPNESADEVISFLMKRYGKLPIESIHEKALLELMQHDKKNNHGVIKLVGLTQIGHAIYDVEITNEQVLAVLDTYIHWEA